MKNPRTFTPATLHLWFLRDSLKQVCLNKPGRAGFSPYGGTGEVSQPPIGHYFFSQFATPHHVHRNHSTETPANAGRPIPRNASEAPIRLYVARQRRLRLCGGAPCPPERATLRQNRKPEIFHAFNPVGHVHRNFPHRNPPAIPPSGRQNGTRRPENPARIIAQPAQSQYLRAFRRPRIGGQSFNVASQFFTHLFLTAA